MFDKKFILIILLVGFKVYGAMALTLKKSDPDSTKQKFYNWFNLDPKENKVYGISTDKAYNVLLKNQTSKPVIVAIIDSGVDIEHEDIKDKLWINEDEIASNGVDDDHNGYVDDVHGWNFLGNSKGENIEHETFELTRSYVKYDSLFKSKTQREITDTNSFEYKKYLTIKAEYEEKLKKSEENNALFKNIESNFLMLDQVVKAFLKQDTYTINDLKLIKSENPGVQQAAEYMIELLEKGVTMKELEKYKLHYEGELNYHLNTKFNPRTIIGDNPENTLDSIYGNNNVTGAHSDHGTHVAGIIGANRNNNLGIKGIADNVKLMIIRAIPDGDERDKDVANAIKYAVNNGAKIINMSFGKSLSPQKEAVDAAIKHAENKNVLLIHAAGNDAQNVDIENNFPTNRIGSIGTLASNWLTIGASSKEANEEFAANFSNYGKNSVDVFAPGVNVYSLKPDNKYEINSGTSMAAPVVSGVAALLMSYFPSLTTDQIKNILLTSSLKYSNLEVTVPNEEEGKKEKVLFKELCTTGGVVNAYEAVKMAKELSKSKHKRTKI